MSDKESLTSYAELAQVIDELGVAVRSVRRIRQLSMRAAAAEAGVSFTTIRRVEDGEEMSSVTLCALLRWLDAQNPAREVTS